MKGTVVGKIGLAGLSMILLSLAACMNASTPPPCSTNLGGEYTGRVQNRTVGEESTTRLVIEQSECMVQGALEIALPLVGSGRFAGVAAGDDIEFTVYSNVSGLYLELVFQGTVDEEGNLEGTYRVPSSRVSVVEQFGRWDATRSAPSQ